MKKRIEVALIFLFLTLFSLGTIYPVLNILGVSLRTDNAFQTRSLSLIQLVKTILILIIMGNGIMESLSLIRTTMADGMLVPP